MEKKYVIVSLNHSTDTTAVFWRSNDSGYTTNPWQAGIYSEKQVTDNPDYYNDGFNTVAVCVTNSSFPYSGVKITLQKKAMKKYRLDDLGKIHATREISTQPS